MEVLAMTMRCGVLVFVLVTALGVESGAGGMRAPLPGRSPLVLQAGAEAQPAVQPARPQPAADPTLAAIQAAFARYRRGLLEADAEAFWGAVDRGTREYFASALARLKTAAKRLTAVERTATIPVLGGVTFERLLAFSPKDYAAAYVAAPPNAVREALKALGEVTGIALSVDGSLAVLAVRVLLPEPGVGDRALGQHRLALERLRLLTPQHAVREEGTWKIRMLR